MTIKDLFLFIADKTNKTTNAHDNHKIMLAVKYISAKLNLSSRIVENWADANFIARDHRVSFYKLMSELGHNVKLSELNSLKPTKKRVL
jgi:hypothetical protein